MSQKNGSEVGLSQRNATAKAAAAPKDIFVTLGLYGVLLAGGLWASLNVIRWFWAHLL
jgi:hypothetical protein